ncbi:unnamed protein product [Rhizophagus irregularis]|nr:unnamed protein product [Rhizophagus irregularis]
MASLSNSQVARMSSQKMKKLKEHKKEREKELYSKECVAQSINFVASKANDEIAGLNDLDRFPCYLATIFARDEKVVAVWLKNIDQYCEIYLSKNFNWLDKDIEYIDNIMKYLKNISKNASAISEDTENDFFRNVVSYCFTKLKSRLDKLKNYIKNNNDDDYVKSFRDFLSTKVGDIDNTTSILIFHVCNKYYNKLVKNGFDIPQNF